MNVKARRSSTELDDFLLELDDWYQKETNKIPLFQHQITRNFGEEQKKLFAGVFYHIRGHFHDFLWYLLNTAPNQHFKSLIIDNIIEESGGSALSHEALYGLFAKEYGIDVDEEVHLERYNLPFVKTFNKNHIRWLAEHDFESGFCAYSAYERLDNVDYRVFLEVAKSFGTSRKGLCFFEVHKNVEHYQTTEGDLVDIWQESSHKVKQGYQFIYSHQLQVWWRLSKLLCQWSKTKAVAV